MAISKRLRFEVFKRDSFTCQYCGKKAPDVVLHADHIHPKSKGGKNDILNLITSCLECNLGKGARTLSDDSLVTKQRDQLAQLQERKEQLSMMMDWQRSLLGMDNDAVDQLETFWCGLASWYGVTEDGKKDLKKWIRQFGVEEVTTAMRIASETYFDYDENGEPTEETTAKGFNKIGGICAVRRIEKDDPQLKDVFYIRGILKNRLNWCNPHEARELLESALSWGGTVVALRRIASNVSTWRRWQNEMFDYIKTLREAAGEETQ